MEKILLVEDEEAIRILYAEELTEEGYQVVTCDEGERATKLASELKPDLIVMDIKLGECNGLDLLQTVKQIHPDLPVILCSAFGSFKDDMLSVAADGFVEKSSDLGPLKHKIHRILEGRRRSPGGCESARSLPIDRGCLRGDLL